MAEAEKKTADGELLVLLLSNGMAAADLTAVIEGLKNSSKSIGSHKRRELYWQAYTKLASKAGTVDGQHCFLQYRANKDEDDEGSVEVVELTKRQRGLIGGGCEVMGLTLKPPDQPKAKSWCIAYSEEDAQLAWDDLMNGEPCIYLTSDGVYVATKYKRALCKGLSSPLTAVKDVEKVVSELAPDKPLKSISFLANDPVAVNGYNTFLAGPSKLGATLPVTIGHVNSTSTTEIYEYFLQRKNQNLIAEANKLIAQMLADVGKGAQPIVFASSTKDAAVAYKNALMKRVFVHDRDPMKKFIERVRKDAQVEIHVIKGDIDDTEFGKFGGLVFELFYRADLSAF